MEKTNSTVKEELTVKEMITTTPTAQEVFDLVHSAHSLHVSSVAADGKKRRLVKRSSKKLVSAPCPTTITKKEVVQKVVSTDGSSQQKLKRQRSSRRNVLMYQLEEVHAKSSLVTKRTHQPSDENKQRKSSKTKIGTKIEFFDQTKKIGKKFVKKNSLLSVVKNPKEFPLLSPSFSATRSKLNTSPNTSERLLLTQAEKNLAIAKSACTKQKVTPEAKSLQTVSRMTSQTSSEVYKESEKLEKGVHMLQTRQSYSEMAKKPAAPKPAQAPSKVVDTDSQYPKEKQSPKKPKGPSKSRSKGDSKEHSNNKHHPSNTRKRSSREFNKDNGSNSQGLAKNTFSKQKLGSDRQYTTRVNNVLAKSANQRSCESLSYRTPKQHSLGKKSSKDFDQNDATLGTVNAKKEFFNKKFNNKNSPIKVPRKKPISITVQKTQSGGKVQQGKEGNEFAEVNKPRIIHLSQTQISIAELRQPSYSTIAKMPPPTKPEPSTNDLDVIGSKTPKKKHSPTNCDSRHRIQRKSSPKVIGKGNQEGKTPRSFKSKIDVKVSHQDITAQSVGAKAKFFAAKITNNTSGGPKVIPRKGSFANRTPTNSRNRHFRKGEVNKHSKSKEIPLKSDSVKKTKYVVNEKEEVRASKSKGRDVGELTDKGSLTICEEKVISVVVVDSCKSTSYTTYSPMEAVESSPKNDAVIHSISLHTINKGSCSYSDSAEEHITGRMMITDSFEEGSFTSLSSSEILIKRDVCEEVGSRETLYFEVNAQNPTHTTPSTTTRPGEPTNVIKSIESHLDKPLQVTLRAEARFDEPSNVTLSAEACSDEISNTATSTELLPDEPSNYTPIAEPSPVEPLKVALSAEACLDEQTHVSQYAKTSPDELSRVVQVPEARLDKLSKVTSKAKACPDKQLNTKQSTDTRPDKSSHVTESADTRPDESSKVTQITEACPNEPSHAIESV
eukprot:TCONS_00011792-protein